MVILYKKIGEKASNKELMGNAGASAYREPVDLKEDQHGQNATERTSSFRAVSSS
jgi:hypothetical protein